MSTLDPKLEILRQVEDLVDNLLAMIRAEVVQEIAGAFDKRAETTESLQPVNKASSIEVEMSAKTKETDSTQAAVAPKQTEILSPSTRRGGRKPKGPTKSPEQIKEDRRLYQQNYRKNRQARNQKPQVQASSTSNRRTPDRVGIGITHVDKIDIDENL